MAEKDEALANLPEQGRSIKEMSSDLFNAIKTPVFWVALGYFGCKFMDRKKNK